jgi:phytanoyl-CoA hydroxylase
MLTPEQIVPFHTDGLLIYGPLLLPEETAALGERIDELASGEGEAASRVAVRLESEARRGGLRGAARRDRVWQIVGATRHDPLIAAHARDPRILAIVAALLGTDDLLLYSDQTLMKPAWHGSPVSWHQDSAYWTNVAPPALVSCWTALDAATEENGCVRMVPGSHKDGVLAHTPDDEGILHVQGVDVSRALPVVLPPGGVSFHQSCTVHGSGSNRTPHRRRGLVTSYMRADFEWHGDPAARPEFPRISP